jgi:hypothetical protein
MAEPLSNQIGIHSPNSGASNSPGRNTGLLDAWDIVVLLGAGWRWGVAGMVLQDPEGTLHTVRRCRSKYDVRPIEADHRQPDP